MVKLKAGPKTFQAKRAAKEAEKQSRLLMMSMSPLLSLRLFEEGKATQEDWQVLCFRITIGAELARRYFEHEVIEYLSEAEVELRHVYAHAVHTNVWSIDADQFGFLRDALNLTDELTQMTTTAEQMPAWFMVASQMNLHDDPELAVQMAKVVQQR